MYRLAVACLAGTLISGCLFGSTAATKAAMRQEAVAQTKRRSAIATKDYPTILAYDDIFLARNGREDKTGREARKRHFAAWLESEVAKLGPPSKSNLDALFATLVAFRRESQRAATPVWLKKYDAQSGSKVEDHSVILRREDLSTVDAALITPRLAELAAPMWEAVDAAEKAGDLVAAIQRGRAITSELPAGSPQAAALAALEQRAITTFLDRARAAGDPQIGARMLYAEIAAALGAKADAIGALATLTPALRAEIGAAWEIAVDGACGDTVSIDGDATQLASSLRRRGWSTATTKDAPTLTVRFAGACPLVARTWTTTEEMPYIDVRTETSREPVYDQQCMPNVYKEQRETQGDYLKTTKWVEPAECHDEVVGSQDVSREIREPRTEQVTVNHLVTTISTSGKIAITVDGQTSEWEFSLKGESTDDPTYRGTHVPAKGRGNYTEMEARKALHDQLVAELWMRRRQVFATRAAKTFADARAAATAGKVLEADHAFYVAYTMLADSSAAPAKEMADWVLATHHVPADALAAALQGQPLPTLDLVGEHKVASIDLPLVLHDYDSLNEMTSGRLVTRALSMLVAAGPAMTKTDTTSSTGGLATLQITVNPEAGMFGFRMTGGGLGAGGGHGFVDFGFNGGYGVRTRGLWLGPVVGLGGDFTTGSQESIPTADLFTVRPGLYIEYGARLAYAFPKNGKLELQYTKALRSTTHLAEEKRGDIRFFYEGLGPHLVVAVRYTEYLPDLDGFFTAFSSSGRLARSTWILGGFGF